MLRAFALRIRASSLASPQHDAGGMTPALDSREQTGRHDRRPASLQVVRKITRVLPLVGVVITTLLCASPVGQVSGVLK